MEMRVNNITDDQAIEMMRDFVKSQEKLQRQREQTIEATGTVPNYTHYTSAKSVIEKFRQFVI